VSHLFWKSKYRWRLAQWKWLPGSYTLIDCSEHRVTFFSISRMFYMKNESFCLFATHMGRTHKWCLCFAFMAIIPIFILSFLLELLNMV
jgi:hypothetical protein